MALPVVLTGIDPRTAFFADAAWCRRCPSPTRRSKSEFNGDSERRDYISDNTEFGGMTVKRNNIVLLERDRLLDEALSATFPASDPISLLQFTGPGDRVMRMAAVVANLTTETASRN